MTTYEIPRPTTGDVVEVILDDHRRFENLLRDLRSSAADRAAARTALAELLIAHGEAEEETVYAELQSQHAIGEHEAEHGAEEHAEGNQALLELLECDSTEGEEFDEAVEALATTLNHHIGEEEQTILNPTRDTVPADVRERLGREWLARRNEYLDAGCASVEQVRGIVEKAQREGLLDGEEG